MCKRICKLSFLTHGDRSAKIRNWTSNSVMSLWMILLPLDSALDMNGLSLDERPQFRPYCLLGYKVHRRAKQIFEIELNAEILFGSRWAIKCDEDVNIAVVSRHPACRGAEQRQPGHTEAGGKLRFASPKKVDCSVSVHGVHRVTVVKSASL